MEKIENQTFDIRSTTGSDPWFARSVAVVAPSWMATLRPIALFASRRTPFGN